jgi:AcrR family transcriptional regulator
MTSSSVAARDVVSVNITLTAGVDIVNIYPYDTLTMAGSRPRPARKRTGRYHHGDLRRALLQEAAATIQLHGVERLTLRAVADRLGVSRTALYRHFTDKSTLLAAVAREGFRTLRTELLAAWQGAGRGVAGFDAMGMAYVQFALAHPSHYRVMFGGFVDAEAKDPEFLDEASGAFQVLVDALVALQRDGVVRSDDTQQLARFVWAAVHGMAMLGIDGQLQHQRADILDLIHYAARRLRAGLAPGQAGDPGR